MLRITVELVPHGMETFKQTILSAEITNEGNSGTEGKPDQYDYTVLMVSDGIESSERITGVSRDQPIDKFLYSIFARTRK